MYRDFDLDIPARDCPEPEPLSKQECPCHDLKMMNLTSNTPAVGCPVSWSKEECECCPSGIVDIDGNCCLSDDLVPTVDAQGKCCYAGYVDACGICGGDGFYRDRTGKCCKVLPTLNYICPTSTVRGRAQFFDRLKADGKPSTGYASAYVVFTMQSSDQLDGDGLCCGVQVDACGVCGGSNTTCGSVVELFAIINMTQSRMDVSTMMDVLMVSAEDLVSTELNWPSALVTASDIDDFLLFDDDPGSYGSHLGHYGIDVGGIDVGGIDVGGGYGRGGYGMVKETPRNDGVNSSVLMAAAKVRCCSTFHFHCVLVQGSFIALS
jgi:hypothetical protein